MSTEIIGKTSATENNPTSCNTLRFWVNKDAIIRPFDIVKMKHLNASYTYAIVQDLQYLTDSAGHLANYVSSDFGDLVATPQNERLGTTVAEAEILFNTKEIEMPLRDGVPVEWADEDGIKEALGLKGFKNPLPAGYISISNGTEVPIEFEAAYLLGPEGAHLNIAGISGLATKTSYAMFLLNSIQQRIGDSVSMVIFNVKGNDLLAIDEPNEQFNENQKSEWIKCGLEPKPFSNVTYLYPFDNKPHCGYTRSHIDLSRLARQKKENRSYNYYYNVEAMKNKFDLLLSDIDDPQSTMDSIVHELQEFDANDWDSLRLQIQERGKAKSGKSGEISVMSWRKFSRLIRTRTDIALFTEKARTQQNEKRHKLVSEAVKELKSGNILVIDIEPLPDYIQSLVVGDVIQTIYSIKLGEEEEISSSNIGKVIVFADELNKYAPSGKSFESGKALTRNLIEITERGRSLGVVLFGAEQFRSGVNDRILGNCSTNVFGRTSPVEIAKCPDYKHFPSAYKATIPRVPQGTLLIQHAVFKTALIKVKFPYPCYYQPKD